NLVKKQIFFTALSIFTLSLSVYILTNTVMSLRRDNTLFSTIFSALASVLVFNNIFFVENFTFSYHLIFQVSALLLIAFSVRLLAMNFSVRTMFGYLLFAILINFIYQGYGGLLVPLVSVFLLSHSRGSLKRYFISICSACAAYIISLAVNIAYIKYVHPIFSSVSYRSFKDMSLTVVMANVKNLIKAQHNVWVSHFTLLPEYFFVSIFILSIVVFILIKKEQGLGQAVTVGMLTVVIFSAIFFSYLPPIFSPALWLVPRTIIGISALPGVIFLASLLFGRLGNGLKFFTGAVILVYVAVLFIYTNRIAGDQIHTNRMDNEYAKLIMQEIVMKEKESGNNVSRLSFVPDAFPTLCYKDVICWGNLNVSARLKPNAEGCEGCEHWSFPNLLRMNSGRSFEVVPMDPAVYEIFFKDRDWDHFSSEQIVYYYSFFLIIVWKFLKLTPMGLRGVFPLFGKEGAGEIFQ
ncbi:MAG: glucosyltransferase domain-containing protein, partial [Nitrospirae bacterium]|nr:glucosyltransferase domain-containing protein [Nitrospirota bacterium]